MNRYIYLVFVVFIFFMYSCNTDNKKVESEDAGSSIQPNPLTELNQQILTDNDNDLLFIRRADYYLSVNKIDSALRDILIAIDIDSKNTNHFITLSDAYLAMGNPDKCLDALDRAIALDNKNKEALLKKAQLYLIMRDYENTYSTISKLIAVDNINPIAYFIRSMAFIEESDTLNAVKNLQVAIDQNQDYFDAHLQLGILFASQKNPVAVNYLQNAISIMPRAIEPYYQLALFFQENGRTESAIQTYNSILDINPEYVPVLYNMGYIQLVYKKDFTKAVDYFNQAIQIAPEYVEAYYNRGYSYELLGRRDLARLDYQEALKLRSNYPLAIEGMNRLDRN